MCFCRPRDFTLLPSLTQPLNDILGKFYGQPVMYPTSKHLINTLHDPELSYSQKSAVTSSSPLLFHRISRSSCNLVPAISNASKIHYQFYPKP